LLNTNIGNPGECLLADYYNALTAYSKGKLGSALEYIAAAVDASVGSTEWYWARARKERWEAEASPEE
jgi:hypothetical protein